ncbi:hypothetical protein KAI46_10685, partial [bacterium]|nr:hypothetical protein [bacterium]
HGWLSKNFDRQDVEVFQARDHTHSMSSVWKTSTTQDLGTFYDAINVGADSINRLRKQNFF